MMIHLLWFLVQSLLLLFSHSVQAFHVPPAVLDFTFGGIAGSAGAIVTYPFDFVKSQLQTASGRAKYKDGIDAFVQIVTHDGPWALYRGVGVQILGLAPEKAIKLSVNDVVCSAVRAATMDGSLPLSGEILAGSMAGLCQVLVTNPLELVKIGLQTSNLTLSEFLTEQIGSVADLYRGAEACIVRDMLFSAILFPLYAHSRGALGTTWLIDIGGSGNGSVFVDLIAASVAATPAAFFATPADCVKTRLQNLSDKQGRRKELTMSTSTLSSTLVRANPAIQNDDDEYGTTNPFVVAVNIAQKEGFEVLFSGSIERMVRSVPQFAVTLTLFDYLKDVATENGLM